jgi:16S rRNA (uracil1498-N3)-methyltransferase
VTAPLFWVSPEALASAGPGAVVQVAGEEARHALAAQRLAVGEPVLVSDAVGSRAWGRIVAARPGREPTFDVRLAGIEHVSPRLPELVLVQALAKQRRDEDAVASATGLGVDRLIPWQAARSVPRWDGAKAERGRERWEQIVRAEGKVARRAWLPVVEPVTGAAALAARLEGEIAAGVAHGIVLHEEAARPLARRLAAAAGAARIYLVIGPEGSIAPGELAAFETAGAVTARLGPEVLRTALATAAALTLACHVLGRWAE